MHQTISTRATTGFRPLRTFYIALAAGACLVTAAGVFATEPWSDDISGGVGVVSPSAMSEELRLRIEEIMAWPRDIVVTYYVTDSEERAEAILYEQDVLAGAAAEGEGDEAWVPAVVLLARDNVEAIDAFEFIKQKKAEYAEQGGKRLEVVDLRMLP